MICNVIILYWCLRRFYWLAKHLRSLLPVSSDETNQAIAVAMDSNSIIFHSHLVMLFSSLYNLWSGYVLFRKSFLNLLKMENWLIGKDIIILTNSIRRRPFNIKRIAGVSIIRSLDQDFNRYTPSILVTSCRNLFHHV